MKKLISLAALTLAATAFAAQTSTTVIINGTVQPSCVFVGTSTPASFDYTAESGTANQVPGNSADLTCNRNTIAVGPAGLTTPTSGSIALTNGAYTLNASYSIVGSTVNTVVGGQYDGADQMDFTVTAGAAAGQWGVPNGVYSGTLTLNVNF